VRFGRKKSTGADEVEVDSLSEAEPTTEDVAPGARTSGPWDSTEVQLDPEQAGNRIDLGGLVVTGHPELEMQLQVDEATGTVLAVVLAGEQGAVELRPFAAPRNGDIWADVRRQLAAEVAQHGGTADEGEGLWGTELRVMMPVELPDGQHATQPSRVLGITGPRWLLRATLFGEPALEPAEDGLIESALREVVVVRGDAAMSPGEPIPMQVPADAQRIDGPDGSNGPDGIDA